MKQLTQQIINQAENILKYIDSDAYKNQILNQDISSVNSQYRQGEFTFAESIELLKKICNRLKDSEQEVDIIEFSMKNNIFTYLQNIYQWISQNPLGYWTNILQYTQTLYQWLNSWGINVFSLKIDRDIDKKIININIKDNEIQELNKLKIELKDIKDSSTKLDTAKNILDFVRNNENIKNFEEDIKLKKEIINEIVSDIKGYLEQSKNLLGTSSNYALIKHFNDVKEEYNKKIFGDKWYKGLLKYIFLSIIVFIGNILLIINYNNLLSINTFNNDIIQLIANGIIRLICLSPSLILMSFLLSLYKDYEEMRKKYEYKSAISSTFEGHIIMLEKHLTLNTSDERQKDVYCDFIKNTINEIFSNPLNTKYIKDNNDTYIKSLIENISIFEKIKSLIK